MDESSSVESNRERRLIEALAALGDWSSRKQIARQLKKIKLNYVDDQALSKLADEGKIEVRKIERAGAIGFRLLYKAK